MAMNSRELSALAALAGSAIEGITPIISNHGQQRGWRRESCWAASWRNGRTCIPSSFDLPRRSMCRRWRAAWRRSRICCRCMPLSVTYG